LLDAFLLTLTLALVYGAAQKELLETQDINELKKVFKTYPQIGWKNICKLCLQERTPEQLKGEGSQ